MKMSKRKQQNSDTKVPLSAEDEEAFRAGFDAATSMDDEDGVGGNQQRPVPPVRGDATSLQRITVLIPRDDYDQLAAVNYTGSSMAEVVLDACREYALRHRPFPDAWEMGQAIRGFIGIIHDLSEEAQEVFYGIYSALNERGPDSDDPRSIPMDAPDDLPVLRADAEHLSEPFRTKLIEFCDVWWQIWNDDYGPCPSQ
jgi:hypothetical protein